jgi:hypothetical protein
VLIQNCECLKCTCTNAILFSTLERDAVGTSVTLSTSAGGNQSSSTKRDDEPEK